MCEFAFCADKAAAESGVDVHEHLMQSQHFEHVRDADTHGDGIVLPL
jgi:hypothetical protein